MANRLRLRPPEEEINGFLSSQDLPTGKVPVPAGDPLNVLFDMLAKRDRSVSILQIDGDQVRDLSNDQPAPPISVLSVKRGSHRDTFRLEVEISWSVAELLGRVGSAFWPIYGAVEEERKRERIRAERRARIADRLARYKQAGRVGYHRTRKASSPKHHEQILAELMDRFRLEREAVEQAIREHRKAFRSAVSQRRRRAILRLNAVGLSQPEIADRCRVSKGLVQHVLRGLRKK